MSRGSERVFRRIRLLGRAGRQEFEWNGGHVPASCGRGPAEVRAQLGGGRLGGLGETFVHSGYKLLGTRRASDGCEDSLAFFLNGAVLLIVVGLVESVQELGEDREKLRHAHASSWEIVLVWGAEPVHSGEGFG